MAQKTKATFTYGDREYYIDDFLKLHADQEQQYYKFARERGSFNDSAIQSLRSNLRRRVDAIKAGQHFDGDGVLSSDVPENITIQTGRKSTVSQGLTDWSINYVNKLVALLTPVNEQKKDSAWDSSKHGLGAYLTGQGLKAQEIFENYDVPESGDKTSKRVSTQRRALLKSHLGGYRNWLAGKEFDFSQNDNDWDDNFLSDLDAFIANYDTLDDNAVANYLRKFGSGDTYATAFTSNRYDLTKTREQLAEEAAEAAKAKEAADAEAQAKAEADRAKQQTQDWQSYVDSSYNTYKNEPDFKSGGIYINPTSDGDYVMSGDEYTAWANNTQTSDHHKYKYNLHQNYYKNPFDVNIASEYLPLAEHAGLLKAVTVDGVVWKYDPGTIDRAKNRFVAYNPQTGETKHLFLWDIEEEAAKIREKWNVNNGYTTESSAYYKDGGTLYMQDGGKYLSDPFVQALDRVEKQALTERATKNGNTEEVQKARDRVAGVPGADIPQTIAQQNPGFTAAEHVRLGSIATDIASIFLTPTLGTITGLASTGANFSADIMDDGFQLSDVGNLIVNAGLDVLGWVPVVGDAAGTGTKIVRKLIKFVPRIMAGVAAYQGLSNAGEIIDSYKKLAGGSALDLTVQDWRNIQQGLSLVVGGGRVIKNKTAANKIMKASTTSDAVVVTVRDKKNNTSRNLLVDGDVADKVRKAGGKKTDVETALNNLEGYKGKFGPSGDYEVETHRGSLQMPVARTVKDGDSKKSLSWQGYRSEGVAKITDLRDFSGVQPQSSGVARITSGQIASVARHNTPDNEWDLRGTKSSSEILAEIQKIRSEKGVDKLIEGVKTEMGTHQQKVNDLEAQKPDKARLKELQDKFKSPKAAKTEKAKITSDQDANARLIADTESQLKNAEADLMALQGQTSINDSHKQMYNDRLAELEATTQTHRTSLANLREAAQQYKARLEALDEYVNLSHQDAVVRRKQKAVKQRHTDSYLKLQRVLSELQNTHGNIGGRKVNWSIDQILKDAGITDAFNQGGVINRHKLNKFLTYAKR